jgi:hypothetical protein
VNHRFWTCFAVLVVLSAAVLVGAARRVAGAPACGHTEVVFYTTDTVELATELSKTASSCADYYVSVGPTSAGAPRGGAPVTTIHSLGSRFHAMAEIRLSLWAGYASANGWYAAGVEVRREMAAAGYDTSLGDTWAINEVGAPSGTQMGVDVLNNAGAARQELRDFVRGLYTGDGGAASRGLIFAADPLQVTGDVSAYKQALRGWYADAAFWQDMSRYVRFWAQETYADARSWGVADSTLAQRTAYLNDYFLHGVRLAAAGDGRSDAARAFFAAAYTPIGNASFRWPAPDTATGIGFGETDIDASTMSSFVSAQTYALRVSSASRFGFAFVPHTATPAETVAVADRVAGAIEASESTPDGACEGDGACGGTVDAAAFNDAWKVFANTLEGSQIRVRIGPAVKVTFAEVTARGATQATTAAKTRRPPSHFRRSPGTTAYDIATTATSHGPIEVCVSVRTAAATGRLHLFRLGAHGWADVTTVAQRSFVCGTTSSLGTFAVFISSPPTGKRA